MDGLSSERLNRRAARLKRVALWTGCALVTLWIAFWRMLPEPLFDEPVAAILLASDGTLLSARIASDGQWRFPPLTHVPEKYRRGLFLYEDKRFEHHVGVDPLAVARAVRLNLRSGKTVSGASTITMQVARLSRAKGTSGEGEDRGHPRGYGAK